MKREALPDLGRASDINETTDYGGLALTYLKHLGTAHRTFALGRRSAIFHCYSPGVLHFPLSPALHTITLHFLPPWQIFVLRLIYLSIKVK